MKRKLLKLLMVSFFIVPLGLNAGKSFNLSEGSLSNSELDGPPTLDIQKFPEKTNCNGTQFYIKMNAEDSLYKPGKIRIQIDTAKVHSFGLKMKYDGLGSIWQDISLSANSNLVTSDGLGNYYLSPIPGYPFPLNNDSVHFETWAYTSTSVDTVSLKLSIVSGWDSTKVISPEYPKTVIYNNVEEVSLNFINFPSEITTDSTNPAQFAVVMKSACKLGEFGRFQMKMDTSILSKVNLEFRFDGGNFPWTPVTKQMFDAAAIFGSNGFIYTPAFSLNNDTVYFKAWAKKEVLTEIFNISVSIVDAVDSSRTWSPEYIKEAPLVNPDTVYVQSITISGNPVVLNPATTSYDITLACGKESGIVSVTPNDGSFVYINGVLKNSDTLAVQVGSSTVVKIKLVSERGTDSLEYTLNLKTPFPGTVLVHSFESTLAIVNNTENNGGFEFTNYQWYQNGNILQGETNAILKNVNSSSLNIYTAELTTSTGFKAKTCPYEPVSTRKLSKINVYPNPVSAGQSITIETPFIENDLQNHSVELINSNGLIVYSTKLESAKVQLKMNVAKGTYLLQVKKGNEIVSTSKIIVTK